jgi:hypothetical protein
MFGRDQVAKLLGIRRHQRSAAPHRRISMSDVVREVVEAGLPVVLDREGIDPEMLQALAAELEQENTEEVAVTSQPRAP